MKKNLKKRLAALGISLVVGTLTGCGHSSSTKDTNSPESNTTTSIITSILNEIEDTISTTYEPVKGLREKTTLTTKEIEMLEYYQNCFNEVEIKYNREDLYPTQSELSSIINYESKERCNKEFNNSNLESIINNIIKNTTEYTFAHNEFSNSFEPYGDHFTNDDFYIALQQVMEEILNNASNDPSEDICHMNNLKIVWGTLSTTSPNKIIYGEYRPIENLLVLDYDNISNDDQQNVNLTDGASNFQEENQLKKVLKHEINHSRQHSCECTSSDDTIQNTISYFDNNTDSCITPFFIEASAESALYYESDKEISFDLNKEDTYDYAYESERTYESMLQLLSLFKDNTKLADYYDSIFSSDYSKLYSFLDLREEKDIYKFWKIVYSMDATLLRNKYSYNSYGVNTVSQFDASKAVGFAYELELYNMLLDRMVDYTINHNDYTIEENYLMLYIIERLIDTKTNLLICDDELREEDIEYFANNFNLSKSNYMNFLKLYYGASDEQIDNLITCFKSCRYNDITGIMSNKTVWNIYPDVEETIKRLNSRFPELKTIIWTNTNYTSLDQYFYSDFCTKYDILSSTNISTNKLLNKKLG